MSGWPMMGGGSSQGGPSLSLRLIAGALLWLALLLALGGSVLSASFREALEQEFGHRLDAQLRAMIASIDVSSDGTVKLVRPLGEPRYEHIFSGLYWQISGANDRLMRSRSLWDATLPVHPSANQRTHITGPRGERLLAVERDIDFPGATATVHVQVAGSLDEVDAGVRRFDTLLVAALALLGLGMAIAVLIQVRFGLRPLRAMAVDLNAVRDGDQPRLMGRYPREVAPLAAAMNSVLDHDEELIERARTHVGNLAHGLKTPLAILLAEMHGVPDRPNIAEQVKAMSRLITYHLGRASAAAGSGRLLGGNVAVRSVALDIAKGLARIFADKELDIDIRIPDDAIFRGQREDLEEMLGNLMENACKWGVFNVRVATLDKTDGLVLTVEDDGPGLDPANAEAASRRGARLDEMAPGWGLGLSIVADIAAVNGGSMEFARAELGGLRVTLSFLSPSPDGAG